MNALRKVFYLGGLFLGFAACDSDPVNSMYVDNYDHEAQIPIDQALLKAYFESHYYDEEAFKLEVLPEDAEGITPLSDDSRLDSIVGIQANDTETAYTLYFLKTQEGSDVESKRASQLDSVLVTYKGMLLDHTAFDSVARYPVWFSLSNLVLGWGHGFQKFLGGTLAVEGDDEYVSDEDFAYKDIGKGFLFFPSGLGYRNTASFAVPANAPLIFEIGLHAVHLADSDQDSVLDQDEVSIDASGNITFIDTDEDGYSDYLDKDDDDDGKLTLDEINDNTDPKDPNSF